MRVSTNTGNIGRANVALSASSSSSRSWSRRRTGPSSGVSSAIVGSLTLVGARTVDRSGHPVGRSGLSVSRAGLKDSCRTGGRCMDDDPPDGSDDDAPHRHGVAPRSRVRRPGRGAGAHRDRRRPQHLRHPLRRPGRRADNRCPHQGGPLGEGSIENGLLRCPWHGYDYDPTHRPPPAGLLRRARRASRSRSAPTASTSSCPTSRAPAHVSDVLVETLVRLGRRHTCSAWSGTRTSGSPTRCAGRGARRAALHRDPARGRRGVRGLGLRQAHRRPAACFAIAGRARRTCSPASTTPRLDGAPVLAISGPGAVEGARPRRVPGRRPVGRVLATSPCRPSPCMPGPTTPSCMTLARQARARRRGVAHLVLPDEVQDLPSRRAGRSPGRPASPTWPSRRPPATLDAALRPAARRPPAGDHRRRRAPAVRPTERASSWPSGSARRCSRRSGPRACARHHPLGAGVLGRPAPGRVLADERVRPAARGRGVVREPHRHRAVQADRAGRRRPDARSAASTRSTVGVLGDAGVTAAGCCSTARGRPRGRRPARRRRRALGDLARREGAAAPPTTGAGASPAPPCSRPCPRHCPTDAVIAVDVGNHAYSFGRYFECAGPAGADVGLPRLDRLRLSRRRWAPGPPDPTGRSSR